VLGLGCGPADIRLVDVMDVVPGGGGGPE